MTDTKSANENLKRIRTQHGLTQKHLAEELGVGEQTISSWERNLRTPSPELLARLCRVLETTPEELGFFPAPTPQPTTAAVIETKPLPQQQQVTQTILDKNRLVMIKRVESIWLSGIANYLSQEPQITLQMQYRPDLVTRSWDPEHLINETRLSVFFPVETDIQKIYNQTDGTLLILGEPGAGKSTQLLMLARNLAQYAIQDENHPIPVIVTMSSWAENQLALEEWLEQELVDKYLISAQQAHQWVQEDQLLLLLDGLDEVDTSTQPACIQAINTYRQHHGLVPVVICSRFTDYSTMPKLMVSNAIVIQPLTTQQIDEYLSNNHLTGETMQIALQKDPFLREIVSTPLMLNITTLAYQDISLEKLQAVHTLNERRHIVFEYYVQHLLNKKGSNNYTKQQAIHWLSNLAQQMQQHHQTVFHLERIQPDWLQHKNMQERYHNTVVRIVYSLNATMNAMLYACFRSDSVPTQPGLFYWLGGTGLGNTILGWMSPGLGLALRGGTSLGLIVLIVDAIVTLVVRKDKLSILTWSSVRRGLIWGIRYGLIFGGVITILAILIYGMTSGWSTSLYHGIGEGIIETLVIGLCTGLVH